MKRTAAAAILLGVPCLFGCAGSYPVSNADALYESGRGPFGFYSYNEPIDYDQLPDRDNRTKTVKKRNGKVYTTVTERNRDGMILSQRTSVRKENDDDEKEEKKKKKKDSD
jgi:hypothetical protein